MAEVSDAPEATVEARVQKHRAILSVAGEWTLDTISGLDDRIRLTLGAIGDRPFSIDGSRLARLDTAGALRIVRLRRHAVAANGTSTRGQLRGFTPAHAMLVDAVAKTTGAEPPPRARGTPIYDGLDSIGRWAHSAAADTVSMLHLFGALCASVVGILTFRRRMRWAALFFHLERVGLTAVPVVAAMSFLIGLILAQQGGLAFMDFGIDLFIVDFVGALVLRELATLLTAIMIAGRSGSAFTAEIGSMKMREEIDALNVLGIGPVDTLVVPRLLALIIAVPLLTVVSVVTALLGAWIVTHYQFDIPTAVFIDRLQNSIASDRHLLVGLIKAPFMALVIGLVACVEGLKVAGNTDSLGRHTTLAVVKGIFMIFVVDGIFALFFSAVGL